MRRKETVEDQVLNRLELYAETYPSIRERLKIISQSPDPTIQAKYRVMHAMAERRELARVEALMGGFHLTRSEAMVALWLAEGGSIAGYAIHAGLSQATVRTHLKAVFAKTGVHRQSSLASLVVRDFAHRGAGPEPD